MDAKAHDGLWLLRIDDLDTPRVVKGADSQIFSTLEHFNLHWDGPVYYQSQHQSDYAAALTELEQQNLLYPCYCSRKTLSQLNHGHSEAEAVYPGYCREHLSHTQAAHAVRLKTPPKAVCFTDGIQDYVNEHLATQHGDFIVKRKDQLFAYPFAVVIDDHLQGVNHVVRGVDLLSATCKQIYVHSCLNLTVPRYLHVPVIVNPDGSKLSKQAFAPAVTQHNTSALMFHLLQLLQQQPPVDLASYPVAQQLAWAIAHWQPQRLHKVLSIPVPSENYSQIATYTLTS